MVSDITQLVLLISGDWVRHFFQHFHAFIKIDSSLVRVLRLLIAREGTRTDGGRPYPYF
jgi:hypothetical protein